MAQMRLLAEQREEMASALAAQASYCAGRTDTDHPVFRGCVDWHSSVHGHWALAASQLHTGDSRYAEQLERSLDPARLRLELDYLRAHPDFEMPYGRAWFLRLATTWKALHPDDTRLDDLANESARSLLAYYGANPPNPLTERYDNASWALINILHYARAIQDAEMEGYVVNWVRTHFMGRSCDLALEERGFIAVCVTWAWLVSEALDYDSFSRWYFDWNPGIEQLAPVRSFPSAHDYGRNFSRAWGFAHLGYIFDDDKLRSAYQAHVRAGFEPQTQWRGEYMANGHWVAQFGMLAVEPLFVEER